MRPRTSGLLIPFAAGGLGLALLIGLLLLYRSAPPQKPDIDPSSGWTETFAADALDPDLWPGVTAGDFSESKVDIFQGRLRLRCATIGTDDQTVKFLGVRRTGTIPLVPGTRISVDLDWNNQQNGTYLAAALVLAPPGRTMDRPPVA